MKMITVKYARNKRPELAFKPCSSRLLFNEFEAVQMLHAFRVERARGERGDYLLWNKTKGTLGVIKHEYFKINFDWI